MKFIPILFSTEMVQALIDNRKNQTRRVVKNHPHHIWPDEDIWAETECFFSTYYNEDVPNKLLGPSWLIRNDDGDIEAVIGKCPYGQPGDVLWIRETFRPIEQDFSLPRFEYKATETINLTDKWKPSLFMPKEACRIFLKITNVRVERLQDISEEDSSSEGIINRGPLGFTAFGIDQSEKATEAFKYLWEKINGEQSWEDNPWVWVIEFEKIELTAEQRAAFLES